MSILGVFNPVPLSATTPVEASNNKFKLINFGLTGVDLENGEIALARAVNNLTESETSNSLTVDADEIPVFYGVVMPADRTTERLLCYYVVEGKGKGTYGLAGNIVLENKDFHRIEKETLQAANIVPANEQGGLNNGGLIGFLESDPNVQLLDLGEIGLEDLSNYLNTNHSIIVDEKAFYVDLKRNGKRILFLFIGDLGDYGLNSSNTFSNTDFHLVFTEAIPNPNKIKIEGIEFDYRPMIDNDGSYPIIGDKALNNWISQTEYAVRMTLIEPDYTLLSSWRKDVLE